MAGAGAEVGDPLCLDHVPEPVGVGVHGMSAVADDGAAAQQACDPEVPHHPAQRGLPEKHIVRAEIGVQHRGLQVLQDHAAVAVHDSLGCAGGAGGEQDP